MRSIAGIRLAFVLLAATPASALAGPGEGLLTQEGLVPGRCFYSKKLRQVACVDAFTEDGKARWHSLEFFGPSGEAVRSLAVDEVGRPAARQDPARLERPNALLAEGGFEPLDEAVADPAGTAGPMDVPGLGVKAEVRDEELVFVDAKGRRVLKVRLPVRRPDVARIVALARVPGARQVACTLVLTPGAVMGEGQPATWTTMVVRLP